MEKLVQGVHKFRETVFRSERDLFERLAKGQEPDTLFITCSDSRISPSDLTSARPGDLFILRNAGNIVPAWDPAGAPGGEAATIEFAVEALGVRDIVICGHSHCGAVGAVIDPSKLKKLPVVARWLEHASETGRIMRERYAHLSGEKLHTIAIAENVLVQLEHLETHPSVAAALIEGRVSLHGWVYIFETGSVFAFDRARHEFVPITDLYPPERRVPSWMARPREI